MGPPDGGSGWAAVFDRAADSYDRGQLSFFDANADALMGLVDVRTGDRVLDVATGTGKIAIRAVAALGTSGLVVGADVSSSMIEVARAKPATAPVRFSLMDARRLAVRDRTFDLAVCAFGLTFMRPHVVRVVREMRRVVRPGGRVAVATFSAEAFSPLLETFLSALERVGIPRPRPARSRWMLLDRRRHVARLLRSGGLSRRRVMRAETSVALHEPEDFWVLLRGTAWRSTLSRLSPEASARVRDDLVRGFEESRDEKGVRLDTSAIIGTGVRGQRTRGSGRTEGVPSRPGPR